MSSDNSENVKTTQAEPRSGKHTGMFVFLIAGLAVALIGDGVLLVRNNRLSDQVGQYQDSTGQQIAKLADTTTVLLDQRLQSLTDDLSAKVKGAETSESNALRMARAQTLKQAEDLRAQLEQSQQQVTGQIDDLKNATSATDNKVAAVSTDVDGVKTDVSGVKTDVATAKDNLDKTTADLKRAMGDMGVMSGLIATNSKDLQALRDLGDRNYTEFDLSKNMSQKKIGDVVLTLKKSDPKHNRFTITVSADDKLVEKKDRTIDEPVQLYVHGNRQPYEIVVNQVKKDEISGYLATPKIQLARQ